MAMRSLGWNMRTPELPTAQVPRLWVILPRAAVPWCHCYQQLTLKAQRVLSKPLFPFEIQPLSYQLASYGKKRGAWCGKILLGLQLQAKLQLLAVFKSAHGGGEVRASCPGSPRPGPSDRLSRGCSCAHPAQQNQRCAMSFPAPGTTQCPFIHFPPVAPAATLALAGCFCYEEKLMAGLDMS